MKLAFLIFKYFPYGGLQRDFLRFANYCVKQGHEVHVFTMQWLSEKPENLHLHLLPSQGYSNHRRAINFSMKIQPQLKNFDKVIGYDRMPGLDFYFAGDLCFVHTLAKKHYSWIKSSSRYKNFSALEKAVFDKSSHTHIFVLTEGVKKIYQSYYETPNERFSLIPPGVKKQNLTLQELTNRKDELKNTLGFNLKTFNLVQIGCDFKRKGLDRSICAIAALPRDLKEKTMLYVIGEGQQKNYERLARKLKVYQNIKFLGAQETVQAYMQAADMLMHPAYFETAGMVLVEALTFGLPVIVTQNCGYAFHIQKAHGGSIISNPFSQEALNSALINMLNKQLLAECSANAMAYAASCDLYSMDEICFQKIVSPK